MDRQGVRTPADVERKHGLGKPSNSGGFTGKEQEQLRQLSQTLSTFMSTTNATLTELKEKLDSSNTTLDYTVKFMVDGEVYEIISVKQGNSVNAPITPPTSESGSFISWQLNNEDVIFPYLPIGDTEFTALFQTESTLL
jgi:hypothetical protein